MRKITESECQEGAHQELRLEQDMSWRCGKCGVTWARHTTPLIFVNETAQK